MKFSFILKETGIKQKNAGANVDTGNSEPGERGSDFGRPAQGTAAEFFGDFPMLVRRSRSVGERDRGKPATGQPIEQRVSEFAHGFPIAHSMCCLHFIPRGLRVHATPPYAARASDKS